jgi:hypothetical protein
VFTMVKSGGVGSLSQSVTLYGKLNADATLAANSVGATDLTVTSDFGSGSAVMQYLFTLLLDGVHAGADGGDAVPGARQGHQRLQHQHRQHCLPGQQAC